MEIVTRSLANPRRTPGSSFLATASIGAVWSSCSPDFGARSVIDRFAQIEPKVLLTVDGYRYNGRDFERAAPDVGAEHVVRFGYLDETGWPDAPEGELTFELRDVAPLQVIP